MVSYHGSDWSEHLGTIEFAHATLVSTSTQLSPFEIDTGRKCNNAITGDSSDNVTKIGISEYAKKFADRRQKIIEFARKNLESAQKKQKEHYDRKRSSVTFNAGDMVMLDARHLNLRHRNNGQDATNSKLVAKKIGPFKIKKMINQNVAKLTLPRALLKLHPSFNIDLLSHFVPNPVRFSSRPVPKAVPVILDEATGDELHIVEALVKKRMVNRQPEWLVRWHGLPEHECTWEKEKNIRHVTHWRDLVKDFLMHQRELRSGRM
uniref:Chromo domain-containing protein n=1 Tax=Peronospora matthiolae TaxID=2874970 RepID=A0AAV1UHC2_9STRA